MKKRLLSVIVSAVLLVSALPGVGAMAAGSSSWLLFSDSFDSASDSYRMVDAKSLLAENDSDGNGRFLLRCDHASEG